MRRSVLGAGNPECWHCGAQASRVELLIPERTGGPLRFENAAAVCPTCATYGGDWDALEFAGMDSRTLSKPQLAQRESALAVSQNHAVPPVARASRHACREYLTRGRWTFPRVRVAFADVAGGVLAEPSGGPGSAAGSALLETMMEAGGVCVPGSRVVWVSATGWQELAWVLIERHAILRRVLTHEEISVADDGNAGRSTWRDGWEQLLEGLDDVRRNRPRLPHRGYVRVARSANRQDGLLPRVHIEF